MSASSRREAGQCVQLLRHCADESAQVASPWKRPPLKRNPKEPAPTRSRRMNCCVTSNDTFWRRSKTPTCRQTTNTAVRPFGRSRLSAASGGTSCACSSTLRRRHAASDEALRALLRDVTRCARVRNATRCVRCRCNTRAVCKLLRVVGTLSAQHCSTYTCGTHSRAANAELLRSHSPSVHDAMRVLHGIVSTARSHASI